MVLLASMWQSRLFWKLVLIYGGLNVAAVTAYALLASTGERLATEQLWLAWLVAFAAISLVTLSLMRRLVGSIATLTAGVEAIARGDFEKPIVAARRDEVGHLAELVDALRREVRQQLTASGESLQRLSSVLGGMDEGVIAVASNRSVLLANPAAQRLLELTTAPRQGTPLAEALPDAQLRKATIEALRQPASRRFTLERSGATERVLGVQITPMSGSPCPGVVLVLHDETELRRLETLREEFVANVSHELKTPLSSIKAYAETLSQGAIHDPKNNLRFVSRIEEQADRLHQLILDLLRLARIEAGEQSFDIAAVPVAQVVQGCLADHTGAAKAKRIQLRCEEPAVGTQIRADEEGLRQILDNLVDNAIKYTPEGGVVTVCVSRQGSSVRLEVRDTGIGIPRELQPRVFERFFRVDKARSRELGGTGLGLSIVKHLAQSFRGSVSVQSQPGEGSTFVVELPAA